MTKQELPKGWVAMRFRMPRAVYRAMKAEAEARPTSANSFCVEAVKRAIAASRRKRESQEGEKP